MEHIQNIEPIFQEPSSDNVHGQKITHVKRVSEGYKIYYDLIWNASMKELFSLGGGFFFFAISDCSLFLKKADICTADRLKTCN